MYAFNFSRFVMESLAWPVCSAELVQLSQPKHSSIKYISVKGGGCELVPWVLCSTLMYLMLESFC